MKTIFISPQLSSNIGNMFIQAGFPFVISVIDKYRPVSDEIASNFVKYFHEYVSNGKTI